MMHIFICRLSTVNFGIVTNIDSIMDSGIINEVVTNGTFNLTAVTDSPGPPAWMNPTPLYYKLRSITEALDLFFVPMLVLVGILGNTLSFVTFTFSTLRQLSSSVYLAALAVADTGFLLCVIASWSSNINVSIYHQPGWCQTFVYLNYIFSFLSVWYVVGFTVERYIAVCFPFKRANMCTVQRARLVVIGLAVLAIMFYTFAIWTSASFKMTSGPMSGHRWCYPYDKWRDVLQIMNTLDLIATLIIPFVVISFLNINIIWMLAKHRRLTNQMVIYRKTKQSETVSTVSSLLTPQANSGNIKVTRMLLVVSFTFLFLNIPGHIMRLIDFIGYLVDSGYQTTLVKMQLVKLFTYLYYVNFSINFLLYNLCGKNFRNALVSLLRCKKRSRANSLVTMNTNANSTLL